MNNSKKLVPYKDINLALFDVGYGFRALLHTEMPLASDECAYLRNLESKTPPTTAWFTASDRDFYTATTQQINDQAWFQRDPVIFRRAVEAPAGFRILGEAEIVPVTGANYLDVRASGEAFNAGQVSMVTGFRAADAVKEITNVCHTPRTAAIMVRVETAPKITEPVKPAAAVPAIPEGWEKLDGTATCMGGDKYLYTNGNTDYVCRNIGNVVSNVLTNWSGENLYCIIRKAVPTPAKATPAIPYGYYALGMQDMIDASKGDRYFRRDGDLFYGQPAKWDGRSVEAALDWFGTNSQVCAVVRPYAIPAGYTLVDEKDTCVEGDRYLYPTSEKANGRVGSNLGRTATEAAEHMAKFGYRTAIIRPAPPAPSELDTVKQELAQKLVLTAGLEIDLKQAKQDLDAALKRISALWEQIETMKKNASGNAVLKDAHGWSYPVTLPANHDRVAVPVSMCALGEGSSAFEPCVLTSKIAYFRRTEQKDGFGRAIFERV